jgi:septum formation protein
LNTKYSHIRQLAQRRKLVLASRSPRRVALLRELGISFKQIIPSFEERQKQGEPAFQFARRLAKDKALSVAGQINASHLVVGCDTIVVLNDNILQKPRDENDAFGILTALADRMHIVCTALALADQGKLLAADHELTEVYFNPVTAQQIRDYIATGEPMDKAGAYGIQGMGAFLVDRIRGNLDNVIGLPRTLLNSLAEEAIAKLNS